MFRQRFAFKTGEGGSLGPVFSPNTANENRLKTVGKVMGKFIITVVYTIRDTVVRIISARQARKAEINDYIKKKFESSKDE